MKSRCYNPNNKSYKNYGARGIKVCDEWLTDSRKFVEWSLVSGWKKGLTLDRIDVNGNYEPNNCRWTSYEVQNNNRRNTVYITFNNQSKPVTQWAKELSISATTLRNRIKNGWSAKAALTTPVKSYKTKEV